MLVLCRSCLMWFLATANKVHTKRIILSLFPSLSGLNLIGVRFQLRCVTGSDAHEEAAFRARNSTEQNAVPRLNSAYIIFTWGHYWARKDGKIGKRQTSVTKTVYKIVVITYCNIFLPLLQATLSVNLVLFPHPLVTICQYVYPRDMCMWWPRPFSGSFLLWLMFVIQRTLRFSFFGEKG